MNTLIKVIEAEEILTIIPLLTKLNSKTPLDILKERVIEISKNTNYECVGLYVDEKLVGISGLWYSTRHYIGKSVEPDHVIIDDSVRGQGLGKQFFNWIDSHVKNKGCEAIELNAYSSNPKSHKFYYNEGYNIYGFHFLKVLRDDKKFY
ncbi:MULTISPECIES: GNAT family N-acetyltransferase [unclassified Polaribacter]|uniref:GNAT family N-acetyltransferase n=1 Tax=unclassified Polaribacter TaxID=196858 RepID=UPI001C4E538B|nr:MULTISPECIES: GNAT family N-acetyltransferase [unclassified Polaribacter]QXP62691.1 GNAT family N-acetyltransferase [Polaribacter sp. HaHaR_3_91]QXP68440.1 GNAT family N-acetyltransferase [Polaribacter sp. AHE13PA]QXP70616.1 GNAT family N-acetyltransferase [Polaribacter sp. R2A056_3_33]